MTHLTPLREKRDRLAKELGEAYPNDEKLAELIDGCIGGNLEDFKSEYHESMCPCCERELPLGEQYWRFDPDELYERFFEVCKQIATIERAELQNALAR